MNKILFPNALLSVFILSTLISCGGNSDDNEPPTSPSSSPVSSRSSTGISNSTTVSSTASFSAPQNVSAIPGNTSVKLSWNAVSGATGYRIYYASEANILINNIASFDDGTRVDNVTSPSSVINLRNNETYYFVVTALNATQETTASAEVSATPGSIDVSKQPSAQEVLVVELVNRARANPSAEAARFGIGLNDKITGTPITDTPKAPLAHNLLLIDSSRKHSQWMLDQDIFSHKGINNTNPDDRMVAAGYQFTGSSVSGENIAWGGTTGSTINLTSYAISQHEGLFKSAGHRMNILSENFRELGVGQREGYFMQEGNNYLSSMLTQNFARSGSNYFLTGVVYSDNNNNEFYDVGEGLSGVTITTNGKSYPVYNSGAYSIPLSNGNYELSITGDTLGSPVYYSVQIANQNKKLDVIKTGTNIRVSVP
ncbi:MAG TPA: CAP domain-containing protein [Cellvibrio sp.]|nr:CAP domain-containing protein [Cellvibrio sp.]